MGRRTVNVEKRQRQDREFVILHTSFCNFWNNATNSSFGFSVLTNFTYKLTMPIFTYKLTRPIRPHCITAESEIAKILPPFATHHLGAKIRLMQESWFKWTRLLSWTLLMFVQHQSAARSALRGWQAPEPTDGSSGRTPKGRVRQPLWNYWIAIFAIGLTLLNNGMN